MPRSNRPRRGRDRSRGAPDGGARPLGGPAPTRRETGPDGDWLVRPVPGSAAAKPYRCPGCDQLIPPGVPHLVSWPEEASVTDRRHWHTACWAARHRRRPGGRR